MAKKRKRIIPHLFTLILVFLLLIVISCFVFLIRKKSAPTISNHTQYSALVKSELHKSYDSVYTIQNMKNPSPKHQLSLDFDSNNAVLLKSMHISDNQVKESHIVWSENVIPTTRERWAVVESKQIGNTYLMALSTQSNLYLLSCNLNLDHPNFISCQNSYQYHEFSKAESFFFSNDGRQVIIQSGFIEDKPQFTFISLDNGNKRQLTAPSADYVPDNRPFLYQTVQDGSTFVYVSRNPISHIQFISRYLNGKFSLITIPTAIQKSDNDGFGSVYLGKSSICMEFFASGGYGHYIFSGNQVLQGPVHAKTCPDDFSK